MTVWDHLFAAVAGLVIPALGALQNARRKADDELPVFETAQKIVLYWGNSFFLWLLAGAAIVVWRVGGRSLDELGLTAPPERAGLGLLLALVFAVFYAADTWRQLATPERFAETRARWRRDTPFLPETPREVLHSLVLVASAAVCEEVVYRGFLVAYVASFTGTSTAGLAAAVGIPAVVFALCHTYQGARGAAKVMLLSGLFGAIYVATGSLWIPIALHFFIDLVGVLLAPRLLAPDPRRADS